MRFSSGLLKTFASFLFAATLWAEQPSYITFPSDVAWKSMESAHFEIIFREGQTKFAERVVKAAEESRKLLMTIFNEAPDKTFIVLADFHDTMNGYALDFPYPHMVLFASPPEATGQLGSLDDWLYSLVLHEYTHILHLYPAHGLWSVMRTIFGTWVVPNGMMPSHLHEGIATFTETHFTKGGRGRGAIFKMYTRKAVEKGLWGTDDFFAMDLLDGSTSRWPHGAVPYFFGNLLYEDLWARKGKEGIRALTDSYSSNWPYLVHGPVKEVYGKNYDELWEEIYVKTKKIATAEIEKIKKTPLSHLDYATNSRFFKTDLKIFPDARRAIFRSASPEEVPNLTVLDLDNKKILDTIDVDGGPAEGMCVGHVKNKDWVVYTSNQGRDQYSINGVTFFDLAEKNLKRLGLKDKILEHTHHLSCTPDLQRVLLSRETGGAATVDLLKWNAGEEKAELIKSWKVPEGHWVNGLLTTPRKVWIALRHGVETTLYSWEEGGKLERQYSLPFRIYGLRLGIDQNKILAVMDVDDRNEVWELDTAASSLKKVIGVVGGVNGFDYAKDFWVSSYEHGGYDIAKATVIAGETKSVSSERNPDSRKPANEIKMSAVEDYSPWGTIFPRTWMPSVLFVPDGIQAGVFIPGFDLSQRHLYEIFGGYDTRGLPFGSFNYVYRFGGNFSLDVSPYYIPSYIVSSQTFIKRWGGNMGLNGRIAAGWPTFRLGVAYKRVDLETAGPSDSVGIEVGLSQAFGFRRAIGVPSPVNGVRLSINHTHYLKQLGSTRTYYASYASADQYWEAPWWSKSAFYLGIKAGFTEGTRFIDQYYEAGGELLFSQIRGTFLNRGFPPGTFLGRKVMNGNLEYRFPIATVERGYGLSPMFLQNIHGALVADVTSTDRTPTFTQTRFLSTWHWSAGAELKSEWKFFYYLPAQLRAGVYRGFGDPLIANDFYISFGMSAGL